MVRNSSSSQSSFRRVRGHPSQWTTSNSGYIKSTFLSRSIVCKVLQTRPVLPNENF
uniref:Uncharacterized protein n=1 Tax=Siphoviridae sp. ct96x5 TaxID=2825367 RepID=A0A8S5PRD7_9CAUD|nr:MAG TPA: hypothetical protein [Siphoviridae sp. ct96x5]